MPCCNLPDSCSPSTKYGRSLSTLLAANISLGVNVLAALLGKSAAMLGDDYDVEIIEAHHRFKKDAPSGTALALGGSVADALGRDLDSVAIHGRKGTAGERGKNEITLLSVRAGDIVGEHTVIFGGIGERLEFIQRAHSRDTFARGALRAAQWLAKKKPGLYGMQDLRDLGSLSAILAAAIFLKVLPPRASQIAIPLRLGSSLAAVNVASWSKIFLAIKPRIY
jgi:4-hydroxy-tetrahydrodipicolinate reductase